MSEIRDVFISYAHIDDKPLSVDERGWVSNFEYALRNRLEQLLGRDADIWRDEKLQGNDEFADEIVDQFSRLKVLVSVVSPRYLESDWCKKEVLAFCNAAREKLKINNKSRIFKVVKTPVPKEKQPVEMQAILGYEFFQEDGDRFREFVLEKNSPFYNLFMQRFEDVAQDISKLIAALDVNQGAPPLQQSPEKSVYLAGTTSDLKNERDDIRRDLEQRGYAVFPDKELPVDGSFRKTVLGYMKRCALTIHLIGGKYGSTPEDEQLSMLEIQLAISEENDMTRLIWMPETLKSEDDRQERVISRLQESGVATDRSDLIRGSKEDFKTIIRDKLKKLGEPPQTPEKDTPRVFLLYDASDHKGVTAVDDYLYQHGIETLKPVFEGSENERQRIHTDNLRICDGVLIYCDLAPESWLMAAMNDLRKAQGYREGRPLKMKSVILAGEKKDFKEHFRSHEAQVIQQFEGLSEEKLAQCITGLR